MIPAHMKMMMTKCSSLYFKARNRYKAGDYAGAMASARKARNLAYASQVCGLILKITVIILQIIYQ
jgi:hypothetical protein